ncbi:MAG TPA: hypothetical protein VGM86_32170 [Thermoanaerobaculia bacterium]|jgi:hypothetical protein
MKRDFIPLLFAITLLYPVTPTLAQTTTHTAETANNTSACSGVGLPGAYCKGAFTGVSSSASGTYDPAPANVSDVPLRQLLYSGGTTKVYAAFMPWFTVCHNSSTYPVPSGTDYQHCNGHFEVGYNSDDAGTVDAQISDLLRRGFDGISIAWYHSASRPEYDGTTAKIRDNLDSRCVGLSPCPMSFLLRLNSGAYDSCAHDGNEPNCVLTNLEANLDYANTNFLGSASYLKVSNRPVISFFLDEGNSVMAQCGGSTYPTCNLNGGTCSSRSDCWSKIWAAINSHVQGYSHGDPLLVFRNSTGFSHTQSDGSFAWVSPTDSTDPYGLAYLGRFYTAATSSSNLGKFAMGGGWKGFDGTHNSWNNSVMAQRCGQTWLDVIAKANAYYSSSKQLPYLLVSTWNDYEEGTEIETGIDNCYAVSASVAGSTLSWSLSISSDQPNAAANATENTIDHYEVFDSSDGENLTRVATLPRGSRSVDLSTLAIGCGSRTLYVKAVGVASIRNKMSGAVSYAAPACAAVTINAPADGATVADPFQVTATENTAKSTDSMLIYLDGTSIYKAYNTESIDTGANVSVPAGPHTLLVKAYYSDGTSASGQVSVTPSNPGVVTVSSPVGAATYNSPILVLADENTGASVSSMEIDLDGTAVATVAGTGHVNQSIDAAPGSHTVTVKATYAAGGTSTASQAFNVRTGTVTITSPADGATVASPIHVVANESSSLSATAMKVYLDGTGVYTINNSDTVDTSVTASSGPHQITVKAWYADGTVSQRSVSVTVP